MLLSKKIEGDILIIGNSRSYRSFDLKFLQKKFNEKKVVNLSKDGNPSIISEINLKNFHNLVGKPDTVIMEFSGLFNDEQAILNFRPFQGKNKEIDNIINLYYPKYFLFGEIFHLFKYNTNHTIFLLYKIINKNFNNILYGTTLKISNNQNQDTSSKKSFRNSKIFEENIISIKNIIIYCKENNIDLRVIIAPISKFDKHTLEQRLIFKEIFPKLFIWDFSKVKSLEQSDFYDINHLNSNGVIKFMNELEKSNFFN